MPLSRFPGSNPDMPGRAMVRVAVPVIMSSPPGTCLNLSASGIGGSIPFSSWFPQAANLLNNFAYFRVRHLACEPVIAGGAASPFSFVFNVSNTYNADVSTITVLNDDYAAMATAMHLPVLTPPASYWNNGSRTWYNTQGASAGMPDVSAGAVNFLAAGGDPDETIGYLVVSMEMEYHTLL